MSTILPALLDKQVDHFVDGLRTYNEKRPHPRSEKDYAYLRLFFKDFLQDQNKRALEVESDAYKKVAESIKKQFPVKTMFNLCIDGRVLPILAFGSSAVVGSSMRVPGGMLREFVRGKDGRLKLKSLSNYANLLSRVFGLYSADVVAEVYDSHIGCAARLGEEQAKGRTPDDFGLYADVSHKKQIAEATIRYVQEAFHGEKRVLPIQTSFDPQTGYLYMGLETDAARQYAQQAGMQFTPEVLKELVAKKKIFSTEKIASDPDVEEMLSECFFHLDWKNDYIASAKKFWESIALLKTTLGPIIEEQLVIVFPELKSASEDTQLEREERIVLLLANTLSGYLHSHSQVKKEKGKVLPHIHETHYPYGVHEEEAVLVSEGGYPPNTISYFVVFSFEEENLVSNVELSATLVRNNRQSQRVKDTHALFENEKQFAEASVPIIVQEVIRDKLTEKQWEEMSAISWDDMPDDWEELSDLAFLSYLQTKKGMTVGVMMGVNTLRHWMARLYDLINPTSSHLVEHYKVALPVIASRYRKNEFIVPFVKLGFF